MGRAREVEFVKITLVRSRLKQWLRFLLATRVANCTFDREGDITCRGDGDETVKGSV